MFSINTYLIDWLVANNLVKEFAVWLNLKSIYRNGCFYKYSMRSLEKKTGFSNTLIKKYIKKFMDLGWCRLHSGNLSFVSLKRIGASTKRHRLEIVGASVREITLSLHHAILKREESQYHYKREKVNDFLNPGRNRHKEHRSAKRYFKKLGYEPTKIASETFHLSLKTIGKMLGRSVSGAHRTIKALGSKIKVGYSHKIMSKCFDKRYFDSDYYKKCFVMGNTIYKVNANHYEF